MHDFADDFDADQPLPDDKLRQEVEAYMVRAAPGQIAGTPLARYLSEKPDKLDEE